MDNFARNIEAEIDTVVVNEWNKEQRAENKRLARVMRAIKDYHYFDTTYFSADMYDEYAPTGWFHKEWAQQAIANGVYIIAGARKHTKTATWKKLFAWLLLTQRRHTFGTMSESLTPARNILADIASIVIDNPRIMFDFKVEVITRNLDKVVLRSRATKDSGRKKIVGQPYSEERSIRGNTTMFNRPELLLVDDLETKQSSLTDEAVQHRIRILVEAVTSLTDSSLTVYLCNLLDERCASNRLFTDQEHGVLPARWKAIKYPAWHNGKPLWKEKYPARTQDELRAMLNPFDESEWQSEYMQNPTPPDGIIIERRYYSERNPPATGLRGALYTDPNLSLKGKGDTTAMTALAFHAESGHFYILDALCRSYNNSNELLSDCARMYQIYSNILEVLAFDGNVNQESTWTNNVRNYERISGTPFRRIEYKHYNVDVLAKNFQSAWQDGKVHFPVGFAQSEHGAKYLQQLWKFKGKKSNRKDDAPDSLLSVFEVLHERRIVRVQRDYKASHILPSTL